MKEIYYVYIIANKRNGTIYIGMTNNIIRHVYENKNKMIEGFSKRHSLTKLFIMKHTIMFLMQLIGRNN